MPPRSYLAGEKKKKKEETKADLFTPESVILSDQFGINNSSLPAAVTPSCLPVWPIGTAVTILAQSGKKRLSAPNASSRETKMEGNRWKTMTSWQWSKRQAASS